MKKISLFLCLLIVLGISSCTKESSAPADPTGTITTNLVSNIFLYEGLADPPYSTIYTTYPYVEMIVGMDAPTLNTSFQEKVSTSPGGYFNADVIASDISAANVGAVRGLGDVTQKPTSGYTTSCMLEIGHGYVVRYKHSYASADQNYYYARFYVSEWVISTSGGIIGAKVKMQYPF